MESRNEKILRCFIRVVSEGRMGWYMVGFVWDTLRWEIRDDPKPDEMAYLP